MDPFEFSKLDKVGSGQSTSTPAQSVVLGSVGGPAAGRAAGGVSGGAVPLQDHVQLSEEAEGSDAAGFGAAVNFGAWTPQVQTPGAKAAGRPGMQAGAVHGPEGTSGLEPGMQPGGIHKASEADRSL